MNKPFTLVFLLSLSFVSMMQGQSMQSIEGLVSITFYEQTVEPLEFTFPVNSTALNSRLIDPLTINRNDFQGWERNEYYDVYYSDSDGTFNPEGAYVSVTVLFDRTGTGGGLNLRGVGFNFNNGISILANEIASFSFAGNYVEGSEANAVNCDLANWSTMGNTRQVSERLRITVGIQNLITAFNYTGCQDDGFSIDINGNTYNESNPTGLELIQGFANCDSLVRINLDFQPVFNRSETHEGCSGDGYALTFNGRVYDETNPRGMEILIGTNGECDTLVEIDLNFAPRAIVEETYLGCSGDEYFIRINDNTYNESLPTGIEFLSSNVGTCDTMVLINLIFEPAPNRNISYTGCAGDPFAISVNGRRYNEENPKGIEIIPNPTGNCDSTIQIDLVFNEQVSLQENYMGCQGDGYTIEVNGTRYSEDNPTGIEVLAGSAGHCDTIITVDLSFSAEINQQVNYMGCLGDGYSVNINGTVYDESNPIGIEKVLGNQACDTTFTIDLAFRDCTEAQRLCKIYVPNAFSPNNDGFNDFFQIYSGQSCLIENFSIQVFNRWGQLVFNAAQPNFNWDGRVGNDWVQSGVFIWRMEYQLSGATRSVFESGSVTLVN